MNRNTDRRPTAGKSTRTISSIHRAQQEERRRARLHEAGHCVLAEQLRPRSVDMARSYVDVHHVLADLDEGEADPVAVAAVYMAGGAAEALAGYADADPFGGSIGPGGDVEHAIRRLSGAGRDPDSGIEQAIQLAAARLVEAWPAFEAVVAALEEAGGRLSGQEVRAALRIGEGQAPDHVRAARSLPFSAWRRHVLAEQQTLQAELRYRREVLERMSGLSPRSSGSNVSHAASAIAVWPPFDAARVRRRNDRFRAAAKWLADTEPDVITDGWLALIAIDSPMGRRQRASLGAGSLIAPTSPTHRR